jgi:chromosome partitioning protein
VAASAAGFVAVMVDTDPQATACTWHTWRGDADPDVIDCAAHTLLPKKLRQVADLGADLAIIDTPPHADIMACEACKAADLLLIPCRPRAFDLDAVRTTAELAAASRKPAFLIFMAGPTRAPLVYQEAGQLVEQFGLRVAPVMLPERAAFHHSVGAGKTAPEIEPQSKAEEDIASLWAWVCKHVSMLTHKQVSLGRGAA